MSEKFKTAFVWGITGLAFFIWFLLVCFLALIFFKCDAQAELKTWLKFFPSCPLDTTTASNQAEIAWERSKGFSYLFEGIADIPTATRILYQHPATIYIPSNPVQTCSEWGETDSFYAWIGRNSYSIDSCYQHYDSTRVWTTSWMGYELYPTYFLEAYDDTNDLDDDGIRDFDSYEGLSTRYGYNYIVDTSADWTVDEWIGRGIYTLIGGLIDTVLGNSADSLWYDISDTTNLVLNPGFETGTDSIPDNWIGHGIGLVQKVLVPHSDSYSVKVRGISGYSDIAVKQVSIQTPLHCQYIFRVWYKTDATYTHGDTTRPLVEVVRADSQGLGMTWYYIPTDSADNNWHLFCDTFSSYQYNAWQESMVVYLGVFQAYGDTSWNDDDSIYFDDVDLISLNGFLPSWKSIGAFGEDISYYPFILDSIEMANHTATAQTESLARGYLGYFSTQEYLMNLKYEGWIEFQKWWSVKLHEMRVAEGFDGTLLDEMWNYSPLPGRNWTIEYNQDGAYYFPDAPRFCMGRDTVWENDYINLITIIDDTLDVINKVTFINSSDIDWINPVDGAEIEGLTYPGWYTACSNWDSLAYGQIDVACASFDRLWQYKELADSGKIVLFFAYWNPYEQTPGAMLTTRYDTLGQMGRTLEYYDEYENTFAGRNRARISCLAQALILRDTNSNFYYWYEIQYGYLRQQYYWQPILDMDLGSPVGNAFEFASGVDETGIPYTIAGIKLAGGTDTDGDTVLVLYKPKSYGNDWWDCYFGIPTSCTTLARIGGYYNTTDTTSWDKFPPTVHSLGATYFPYRWDGTYDSAISSISLRFSEGAILRQVCQ